MQQAKKKLMSDDGGLGAIIRLYASRAFPATCPNLVRGCKEQSEAPDPV